MKNKQEILTEKQRSFLKKVGANVFLVDNFYLTGGTALAAFYLFHRHSDDLDFFSEKEIDVFPINVFLKSAKKDLGIRKIDFQQSFNRNLFFLHYTDGEALKTEFTFYPFPRIEKGKKEFKITIDSILDIGVNKLFTIYQRSQIKDFIDLYVICAEKQLVLSDVIKKAKIKFDWHIDPLQLGSQLVKIRELKDFPNMTKDVGMDKVEKFFIDEAKKLKNDILK